MIVFKGIFWSVIYVGFSLVFIHKIITTFINNLHPIYYYRSHHYTDATIKFNRD